MRASLLHPVADVYFLQAGGDNGDAVAVYASLVVLYSRECIAVGVELQGAAEIPGGRLHVAVHHGDPSGGVGAQHVAEEGVPGVYPVAQQQDVAGLGDGLRGLVPGGDVLAADDGLQLHRRHEGGDGEADAFALQAYGGGEGVLEEVHQVQASRVLHPQVVVVLHVHVVGQASVEVDGPLVGLLGQGGVVHVDDPCLPRASQLVVEGRADGRRVGFRPLPLSARQVAPHGPGDVEVVFLLPSVAREEAIEVAGHFLVDVQQVFVDVAQDGIVALSQALSQDAGHHLPECLGVDDGGEVGDGVVGGFRSYHPLYQPAGLLVQGRAVLHVCHHAHKAYDEVSHVSLRLCEISVSGQLSLYRGANGVTLMIHLLGQPAHRVVHELLVAEAEPGQPLAQGLVHGLPFLGLQPVGDERDEIGCRGHARRCVRRGSRDGHHGGGLWLGHAGRLAEVVVHHVYVGHHLVLAVVDVYGRFHVSWVHGRDVLGRPRKCPWVTGWEPKGRCPGLLGSKGKNPWVVGKASYSR